MRAIRTAPKHNLSRSTACSRFLWRTNGRRVRARASGYDRVWVCTCESSNQSASSNELSTSARQRRQRSRAQTQICMTVQYSVYTLYTGIHEYTRWRWRWRSYELRLVRLDSWPGSPAPPHRSTWVHRYSPVRLVAARRDQADRAALLIDRLADRFTDYNEHEVNRLSASSSCHSCHSISRSQLRSLRLNMRIAMRTRDEPRIKIEVSLASVESAETRSLPCRIRLMRCRVRYLTEMAWLVGKADYKFNCAMDVILSNSLLHAHE